MTRLGSGLPRRNSPEDADGSEPARISLPVRSAAWAARSAGLLFSSPAPTDGAIEGREGNRGRPGRLIERNQEPRGARHGSRFVFVFYPRARSGVLPVSVMRVWLIGCARSVAGSIRPAARLVGGDGDGRWGKR